MIRLDGVSCGRDGACAVEDIQLVVNAQEIVVVTGARGAGKSVLCAVAAARRMPARGAVWIAGRNVVALQRTSLPFVRRNIAYLPAPPALVDDDTAFDNVLLALAVRGDGRRMAEEEARRALAALGLSAAAARRVSTLSDGERRLVALARALAGRPPVLVLDEPAAGLDLADRARVLEALEEARAQGAALLCATADDAFAAALVERGARRARIEAGRLLGGAPPVALVGAAPARPDSPAAEPAARVRGGAG